ncbi:MAG: hypothetical protein IKO14_06835 [Oscillibacter sp.]|nr:hypothetical protein [Oscillibacter sp.]
MSVTDATARDVQRRTNKKATLLKVTRFTRMCTFLQKRAMKKTDKNCFETCSKPCVLGEFFFLGALAKTYRFLSA